MSRFQLVQKSEKDLVLRLIADDKESSFAYARQALTGYLTEKGAKDISVVMSDEPPTSDKVSGKFKHILKDFS